MNQTPIPTRPPEPEKPGGTKPKNSKSPELAKKDAVKIYAFAIVLLLLFVTGLLFFLRPDVSESEKRKLAEFPSFSWSSLLSGDYFSDISTWYSDTFPGREGFISLNQAIKKLYGIRTVQLVQNPPSGNDGNSPSDPDTPGNGEDNTPIERFESVYVKVDRAFEIYYFSASASDRYVNLINSAAEKMSGVEVYDLIAPLSYSVYLSAGEQEELHASDVSEAISYMYGKMNSRVHTVEVLPSLLSHKDEYLYFRTDHHWTARGAYYAYEVFCGVSGQTARSRDAMRHEAFSGFLGTLYTSAGQPDILKKNPDVVEAWVPNSTNSMQTLERNGIFTNQYMIVNTYTNGYYKDPASKYNCFIAGDNPLTIIKNPDPSATNGKTIVVVKESYGNAFVPFLVDQYAEVHVIDYRYFQSAAAKNGSIPDTLPDYVASVGADQVLFINYIYATAQSDRLKSLEALLG